MTRPGQVRKFIVEMKIAQSPHSCQNIRSGGNAASSSQRIGTVSYAPPDSEVVVFADASQVEVPYYFVKIISFDNPGKYQVVTVGDAIEPLEMKAQEIGANGIIIDKSQPIKSGIISTGVYG